MQTTTQYIVKMLRTYVFDDDEKLVGDLIVDWPSGFASHPWERIAAKIACRADVKRPIYVLGPVNQVVGEYEAHYYPFPGLDLFFLTVFKVY